MVQVDFVLRRGGLLDQGVHRQLLGGTGIANGVHQRRHALHGLHAVGLAAGQHAADPVGLGVQRPTQTVVLVPQQVELHLASHHRGEAARGKARHQCLHHVAAVVGAGLAVDLLHGDHHLGHGALLPGHRRQGAQVGDTVAVAIAGTEHPGFAVPAPDIADQGAQGQLQLAGDQLVPACPGLSTCRAGRRRYPAGSSRRSQYPDAAAGTPAGHCYRWSLPGTRCYWLENTTLGVIPCCGDYATLFNNASPQ